VSSEQKELSPKESKPKVQKPSFLPVPGVEITDFDDNYATYHYPVQYKNNTTNIPDSSVASFRGNVYDLKTKQPVIESFGYAKSYSWDSENEVGYDVDNESSPPESIFDEINSFDGVVVIRPGYEGTIIRRRKGYYSTHKKLQCDRSHWGGSKFFKDMYNETNPPSEEELFGGDKADMTYITLVCNPDNTLTSAYDQESKLYYLEAQKPTKDGLQHILPEDFPITKEDGSSSNINIPKRLSVAEAKDGLVTGVCPFIVISYYSEQMTLMYQKKVYNGEYWETLQWRGNDPNPRHQFYSLLDLIEPHKRASRKVTSKEIRDELPQIHEQFVACLPRNKQEEARGYLNDLSNSIGNLASHIIDVHNNNRDGSLDGEYWITQLPRYKFILSATTTRASKNLQTQKLDANELWQSQKRKMNMKSFDQFLRVAIIDLLWKERGTSLYSLVRAMEKDKQE
jgi:hypothetical protein